MLTIVAKVTSHPIITSNFISFIGIFISVITVIALFSYGKKYVDSQNIRAQLDAKDSVIDTNSETIQSLKDRLNALENDFESVTNSLDYAKSTIEKLRFELKTQIIKYEELETYTAPEAIKVVLSQHKEILSSLNYIKSLLEGLSSK